MGLIFKTPKEKLAAAKKKRSAYEIQLRYWEQKLKHARIGQQGKPKQQVKKFTRKLAKLRKNFPEAFGDGKGRTGKLLYRGRKISAEEDWDETPYSG